MVLHWYPLLHVGYKIYLSKIISLTFFKYLFFSPDQIHYSWTALHYAVLRDNPDCLKVLVRAGKICFLLKFPVCLYYFVFILFLYIGADCEQKDGLGRSPLMIAGDHEKKNAEEYLKTV